MRRTVRWGPRGGRPRENGRQRGRGDRCPSSVWRGLTLAPGAADACEEPGYVGGGCVSAPRDVLIGSYQQEIGVVAVGLVGLAQIEHAQGRFRAWAAAWKASAAPVRSWCTTSVIPGPRSS
jgi:hypothetical protein